MDDWDAAEHSRWFAADETRLRPAELQLRALVPAAEGFGRAAGAFTRGAAGKISGKSFTGPYQVICVYCRTTTGRATTIFHSGMSSATITACQPSAARNAPRGARPDTQQSRK